MVVGMDHDPQILAGKIGSVVVVPTHIYAPSVLHDSGVGPLRPVVNELRLAPFQ